MLDSQQLILIGSLCLWFLYWRVLMRSSSQTRASCFIGVSKHLETIKTLGLRTRAFICFSVFGYPDESLALVLEIVHKKTRTHKVCNAVPKLNFLWFGYWPEIMITTSIWKSLLLSCSFLDPPPPSKKKNQQSQFQADQDRGPHLPMWLPQWIH